MINRELKLFFTALSFYTRLPAPAFVHKGSTALLPDSIRYLPLIGWITGGVAAVVYLLFNFLFGNALAVLFSMVATVLLTGAFHEDGFADVCDGFGGGWTKEKILEVMKDSRLGTYGVTGLVLLLGIKFIATIQVTTDVNALVILGIFIIAHSLSRFAAIMVVFSQSYARSAESKIGSAVDKGRAVNLIIAAGLTLLPLAGLIFYTGVSSIAFILIPVVLLSYYLGYYFKKWIGGYTGDCLGAVQQLTEVVIYLSLFLIWKFI
ncbi:adenosylcobinamide-GDP ribazoletransferase [Pedobacter hartonius]|uniref:Adenosylcobinamide-GDP ribazoletransferase n=1 Tax=Pedobacter hartonius TaxID=425514 RepID=A0A1H4AR57_9SPHI|nr:adenosylcobinamide-GDP ribazoletransferase [Pedobacter hartonius]SEA38346.1 cobalamin-5'-phosphate synthase [Pedobacter hartonius]